MAGYSRFWPAVRDEFKRGSTPEEAFRSICKKNGLNPPSYKTIGELLDRFYDEDFSEEDADGNFHDDLRSAIIGQYLKLNHAVSSSKFSNRGLDEVIMNNRFKLDVGWWLEYFDITDLFNKDMRKLEIAPFDEPTYNDCTMAQIDHNLVLFSRLYDDYHQFLLQIDFNTQTCSILDTVKSEFLGSRIITDSTNCSKFAYLEFSDQENGYNYVSIYKGSVINNRITMDDRQINFNCDLYLCKFENGNVFGFRDIDGFNWQFCKFSPDMDPGQIVNSYDFELPDYFDSVELREADHYVWSKSKIYVPTRRGSSFMIVVFDAETYMWTQTKVAGKGLYHQISIDENEILTVSAEEHFQHGRFKTVYRFPMKKPDKLKYLAWSTIHRGSLFFESNLYERLLPRLPLNSEFRPFSENYVYNLECDMEH